MRDVAGKSAAAARQEKNREVSKSSGNEIAARSVVGNQSSLTAAAGRQWE